MQATIISFYTKDFAPFAQQLRKDCDRNGHPHYIQEVDHKNENLIEIFDQKVKWICDQVLTLGRVVWLDVECRLIHKIPEDWQFPFMTFYGWDRQPRHPSSGVFGVGPESLPMLEEWYEMALSNPVPDDFVFEALLRKRHYKIYPLDLEFVSRTRPAPVVRGQWANAATIIQHPTINRWLDPLKYKKTFGGTINGERGDPLMRARKQLFYRNFGGCFEYINYRMERHDQEAFCEHGWFFDPASGMMAPEIFWPDIPGQYDSKPTHARRYLQNFQDGLKVGGFRRTQVARMTGASWWQQWFPSNL